MYTQLVIYAPFGTVYIIECIKEQGFIQGGGGGGGEPGNPSPSKGQFSPLNNLGSNFN